MGTLQKCEEEFIYSVNNPRGGGQGKDLHSRVVSFFGIP